MYILTIDKTIKKMTVKELKDFIFENYHEQMGFAKENSYYSIKFREMKAPQFFATKLTEKYLILTILTSSINHF